MNSLQRLLPRMLLILLPAGSLGCGSKGAVSLLAHVETANLTVTAGPLGATLAGQFDLVLELGSLAPRPTSVSQGAFAVRRGSTLLVETLSLSASESLPVELQPGDRRVIRFTLDSGAFVGQEAASALCAASVFIDGTLTDTLSEGKPTPASSAEFQPECP